MTTATATITNGPPDLVYLAFLAWITFNGLFLGGVSLRYWWRYGRAGRDGTAA